MSDSIAFVVIVLTVAVVTGVVVLAVRAIRAGSHRFPEDK